MALKPDLCSLLSRYCLTGVSSPTCEKYGCSLFLPGLNPEIPYNRGVLEEKTTNCLANEDEPVTVLICTGSEQPQV